MASLQNESEDNFLKVEKIIQIRLYGSFSPLKSEETHAKIVKAIEECPGLTTLHLEVFIVGIEAPKAIGRALESQSSLKKVLWKHMFNYANKTEISLALSYMCKGIITAHAHIVVLDLSQNNFDSNAVVGLQNFFESPCCYTLEELKLNNNLLGVEGAKILSEYMCKCMDANLRNGKPTKLKVFECSNNELENEGVAFVSKFLDGLSTLESIDLSGNGIGPTGMRELSCVFYSNLLLKKIILDTNPLSEDGVNYLACGLQSLRELRTLSLSKCHLRGSDVRRLASAMETSCPELRRIDLSLNEIDSGVDVLLDAVENKARFQDLNINLNKFNPKVEDSLLNRIYRLKMQMVDTSSDDDMDTTDAFYGKESTSDEE